MSARNETAGFDDVKDHAKKAARETLLAVRTVIDAGLRALSDESNARPAPAEQSAAEAEDAIHPRPGDVESPPPV